jgi:hypothetical protein
MVEGYGWSIMMATFKVDVQSHLQLDAFAGHDEAELGLHVQPVLRNV